MVSTRAKWEAVSVSALRIDSTVCPSSTLAKSEKGFSGAVVYSDEMFELVLLDSGVTISVDTRLRRGSSVGGFGNVQASEGEKGRTDIGDGIVGLLSFIAALSGTISHSEEPEAESSSEIVWPLPELSR